MEQSRLIFAIAGCVVGACGGVRIERDVSDPQRGVGAPQLGRATARASAVDDKGGPIVDAVAADASAPEVAVASPDGGRGEVVVADSGDRLEDLSPTCVGGVHARIVRDGECWEVLVSPDEGAMCEPRERTPVADVSLAQCALSCIEGQGNHCDLERFVYYAKATRECLLNESCEITLPGYDRYYYIPCVTAENETWRWRAGTSPDRCASVHPSWTRLEGVSLEECTDACEAHASCGVYRWITYSEGRRSCILNATCTPEALGYASLRYEPNAGCD